jgi:biopolymer transport protein ExbB
MNFISNAASFYREGGMFMHAVLVLAVLIIAIVSERMIVIGRAASLNGRRFADDLVNRASRGDLQGARNLSTQSSAPVARVAQAMLQMGPAEEDALHAAADDAATLCLPDLSKRIPHLAVLANSATLIGLLGTITGLITAIAGVGVADASQRSAYLTAGISEALHTTAFGLMVAIPTLMIQGWLNSRVEAVAQDIEQLTVRLSKAMTHSAAAHRPQVHAVPAARPVAPRVAGAGGGD